MVIGGDPVKKRNVVIIQTLSVNTPSAIEVHHVAKLFLFNLCTTLHI